MSEKVTVCLADPRGHYSPADGVKLQGGNIAEVELTEKVKSALAGRILKRVQPDDPRLVKARGSGLAPSEPAKTNRTKRGDAQTPTSQAAN